VMDPVRAGLGDRLAGVFAETTPEKRLSTAADALSASRAADADVLVGLGGGSSLDVAAVTSLLAATDRDVDAVAAELAETGTIAPPDGEFAPLVAVPTTLAGADMSMVAGVTAGPESGLDSRVGGGVSDPRLMPRAVVPDPELVATTPRSVLAGSAMNGFDKGIETLYAAGRTPVTDATAARGLSRFREGMAAFEGDTVEASALAPVVEGMVLLQYGISRPTGTTLSLIHAFGHALTRTSPIQQGAAHGIVAPHALTALFESVDGRRELLASALGVGDAPDPATAVVDAVATVRDTLGLPTRLRDVDGPKPAAFESVARAVLDDGFIDNVPEGFDPSIETIEAVLRAAY